MVLAANIRVILAKKRNGWFVRGPKKQSVEKPLRTETNHQIMNLSNFTIVDFDTSVFVFVAFVILILFCTIKLPTLNRDTSRMWKDLIEAKKRFERKL